MFESPTAIDNRESIFLYFELEYLHEQLTKFEITSRYGIAKETRVSCLMKKAEAKNLSLHCPFKQECTLK